ncbi:S24 family peptidase [Serratia sp. N21D137]|uniref:HumD family translesion DNA polymerase n=1 Tax=Serratia sp. N21D137 TaxID=3397495 RepID=UPI0039E1C57C
MASKFPSPAQDYVHSRIGFDELCGTSKASVYLVTAKGGAITAGIHPGATLVVDRSVEAVDGSVILASVGGELAVRRLRLVPVRCLEYLDGSENVTMIDEGDDITDDCGAVEVFGVVTYALNDMRTCEFDDLVV